MLTRTVRFLVIAGLITSFGCKKDEAEDAPEQSPEKVEKASSPDKAEPAQKKQAPKKRTLVKKPAAKKPANVAKPAAKRNAKKVANAAKAKQVAAPKKPVPAPKGPTIARKERQAGNARAENQKANADEARLPTPSRRVPAATQRPPKEPRVGPIKVRPNAELLLRQTDIKEVLDAKGAIDVHSLTGADPEDTDYDGIYWGSTKGGQYIAGVQIWKPRSPIEAQRRFSQMLRTYPNAQETQAVANRSFLAHWNDFIHLTFFDPGKMAVVTLTCHRKSCTSPQKLVQLGSRIKERL